MALNGFLIRSIGEESYSTGVSDTRSHEKRTTLTVRRMVYAAAQELQRQASAGCAPAPSMAATEHVTESLAAGNKKAARFWSEVHLFIVARDYLDGQLQIIEDAGL